MTSLPLQLWPGASGEMYLCYSGVFSLTQAQHGNSGEWEGKRLCGILSRDKTFRGTGVQRPAEKSVRERSTRGPRLSLKEPLLGGGAQEEGVHWSKVLTSFSRIKTVYSCAHPEYLRPLCLPPPFVICFLITSLISSLP